MARGTGGPTLAGVVAGVLSRRYGDFAHGNKSNPLDELLYILCSVKTAEGSYQTTYRALKRQFPTFAGVAEAPATYIAKPIERGGLSNQKAKSIRAILDRLVAQFGRPTLAPLHRYTDEECEAFLTALPGVGKKVARCVMMYSLGRRVFPVDTHCWRVCRRLGWIRPSRGTARGGQGPKTRDQGGRGRRPRSAVRPRGVVAFEPPTPRDMDRLQEKIPPELRFSLHVNMVSLGREVCTARNPKCGQCPIAKYCRKVGVR